MYIWLGLLKYKKESISGLPIGYDLSQEIRNIERPRAIAPTTIHYLHKHVTDRLKLINFKHKFT